MEMAGRIPARARSLKADLIVVAGDLTHFGGREKAREILEKIAEAGLQIFFVSGNCDSPELLEWSPEDLKATNLHGRVVEFSGYLFAGVGGGSGKFGTLTELEEGEFEEILRSLKPEKPGRLILVAHSPPYGIEADYTGVKHIGSAAVRRFVEDVQPILVCAGHAHEGRSITRLGETIVVNAGAARDGFCAVIDVEDGRVDPQLLIL